MKTVLSQNYFTFAGNIYQLPKGIAMGSPISRTIAEIFLQHYENMFIKHLLECKKITYYTKYVDDILVICDKTIIDPDRLTNSMNHIHKNITFKPTSENNEQINFLDLLLIWKELSTEVDIYRKPTTTDTTINVFSNNPIEHKIAAYRYYITCMHPLPLSQIRKKKKNGIPYNM